MPELSTLAPTTVTHAMAPTFAPMAWATVTPKGVTVAHVAHSATAQAMAPRAVRLNDAQTKDLAQLKNGNFAACREVLALFKGRALVALQSQVVGALSQVQDDGTVLVPVIPWDNVRAKVHAVAIAAAIVATPSIKGKKAIFAATMQAWINMENAAM